MHHGKWFFVCIFYNNDTKGSLNVSFISGPVLSTYLHYLTCENLNLTEAYILHTL